MIQLGRTSTCVTLSGQQIAALQTQFEQLNYIHLPGVLSPDLLLGIMPLLDRAEFSRAIYEDVGTDLRMADNAALEGLHVAVNDVVFLQAIELLTACRPLRVFAGRVYRMVAEAGHTTGWHDDASSPDRRIGMSINLSAQAYSGGVFQIRRTVDERLLGEVHNLGLGDAILFRLSHSLQHRVTDVTGEHPKTAFAGWFRPDTSYREALLSVNPSQPSTDQRRDVHNRRARA
jgi:2OG-Fe(II) oxygenase superfamily